MGLFGDDDNGPNREYWKEKAEERKTRIEGLQDRLDDLHREARDVDRLKQERGELEEKVEELEQEVQEGRPEPVKVKYEDVYEFNYTEHDSTILYEDESGQVREMEVTFDEMNIGKEWVKFKDYNGLKWKGINKDKVKPRGKKTHTSIRKDLVVAIKTTERRDRTHRLSKTKTSTFRGETAREKAEEFVENHDGDAYIVDPGDD